MENAPQPQLNPGTHVIGLLPPGKGCPENRMGEAQVLATPRLGGLPVEVRSELREAIDEQIR